MTSPPPSGTSPQPTGAGSGRRGLRLGRFLGIDVRLHPSFLLLGVLAATSVSPFVHDDLHTSDTVAWTVSALIALGLLASVLLHELAHAVVGVRLGVRVLRIDLWGLGGATVMDGELPTARTQYLVSVVGPLVNVAIGGVCALVWVLTDHTPGGGLFGGSIVSEIAARLAFSNGLLAVYNMLPGLPLDGGQILRAAVWGATRDKVTGLRAAGWGGALTALGTAFLGLVELRKGGADGLITLLVAAFVGAQALAVLGASDRMRKLPAVVAGRLAHPAYVAEADLPLAEALRRAQELGRSAVVLLTAGIPTAVLNESLLAQVPGQRRPWVQLSSVALALRPGAELAADLSGEALLEALRADPAPEHLVMQDGRLVGVLRTSDVAAQLSRHPA